VWRSHGRVPAEAWQRLEEGLTVVTALAARQEMAFAWRARGIGKASEGRLEEARAAWQHAGAIYASLGDAEGEVMMLNNLSGTAPTAGAAIAGYRAALARALGADEPHPAAMASSGLGKTLLRHEGASSEARASLLRAIALHDETGFHHFAHGAGISLVSLEAARGAFAAARAVLAVVEERIERHRWDGHERDRAEGHAWGAFIDYLDGELDAAAARARWVLESGEVAASATGEALARTVALRVALERHDLDLAASELARARTALERTRAQWPPGTWHDTIPAVRGGSAWARLLLAETDLAIAQASLPAARTAASEAISLALQSAEEPAVVIALTAAAGVLRAAGSADESDRLVAELARHPATPFEARHAAARFGFEVPAGAAGLGAADPGAADSGAADSGAADSGAADSGASDLGAAAPTLRGVAESTLSMLTGDG
jgi:hypothetical protein